MMTRKDFQELADVVKRELMYSLTDPADAAMVARELARVCKRSNPAFKADKFYRACGLEEMADN